MTMRILTLCASLTLLACNTKHSLFEKMSPSDTGIDFVNRITETDSINIIDQENVYNGGGVAAGDFNGDGLADLYFSGNLVPSKLYINKGDLRFQDVTAIAGVDGMGRWGRGVATVDINSDGKLDIYLCATLRKTPAERENMLYVNQGNDKNGVPLFREMGKEYGLADNGQSTMAAFFDYDNDGDLDCYIATNEIVEGDYPNRFRPILNDGSHANTDRLYRNDWNDSLRHPVFTNVSKEAGIQWEGYAHGLNICDINMDGWKDIYVSNDYLSGNEFYINNRNGTFTNRVYELLKHSSANAMGNDVIDINNDGLSDIIELDMNPEDNYRKKMMMNPNSYQTYQNTDYFNYPYQYVRNSLQVNLGNVVGLNDSLKGPAFAETSYFSGVAETDWSWTPSVADFDNDGLRDIIISNGFPKDVTDHDFVAYRDEAFMVASKKQLLEQIPEVKINNYAYRNTGNVKFEDRTKEWGFETPSFSNGAIYVDLDNDGDLDYVCSNINDAPFVYRNRTNDDEATRSNYIRIKLQGDAKNTQGLGAWVELYADSTRQVYEHSPYRGYLSTVDNVVHFGLGKIQAIDSIVVKWPGDKKQTIAKPAINTLLTISMDKADGSYSWDNRKTDTATIFREVAGLIDFTQKEKDFIDFNIQKLLPHKLSQYGPALVAGDINGDGLDDVIAGGSKSFSQVAFVQKRDGSFASRKLLTDNEETVKQTEDMGLLLLDADRDGDLDLYVASGTYENLPNTSMHRDIVFVNDGKGNFTADTTGLPLNYTSKSCVKAADFDHDGDLDLFIGGRVYPGSWPKAVSSYIYRNDSRDGKIRFTDVTKEVAPMLNDIGMVCDALWTDVDNDGWRDLLLAGEFMPLTILKNGKGKFSDITPASGIGKQLGWWNSLAAGDFDNDGDIDYVAGNLGLNSFYKASDKEPVVVLVKDFDKNNATDAIPGVYTKDVANGTRKLFPVHTRDDMIKQIISFRQKFPAYKPYAKATLQELFTAEEMKDAVELKANDMRSVLIRNEGGGKFSMQALPDMAQWSIINGMTVEDVNGDGNLDILAATNDYGTEVTVGRYDALNGLVLLGNGLGGFRPATMMESGICLPADGKSMIRIMQANGNYLLLAGQNKGPLKTWVMRDPARVLRMNGDDETMEITLANGKKRKQELYVGDGFLSQSARLMKWNPNMRSVEVTNGQNQKRTIQP